MTILERIALVMKYYNWNKSDLARAMKMSTASSSQLFKRKSTPSYDSLLALCQSCPDLSVNWLITGAGTMHLKKSEAYVDIPVSGDIAAGNPIEVYDLPPITYVSFPSEQIKNPRLYTAFRVHGDSMFPHIQHGDVVLFKSEQDTWSLDGKVCAIKIDTEVTLKKLWINPEAKQTILLPFNEKYSPIILSEDSPDCFIIGFAVSLVRHF